MLLVLFPAVQTKTMVTRSLLPISTVACKGPFCVEVLSSFYGRFFVEEGQFINSTSSLHLCRHFFYLLTPPRFGALNRESESSGSQPVYRKLFSHGPHSSKNNFFGIKISRPTPWVSLSVLLWLLLGVIDRMLLCRARNWVSFVVLNYHCKILVFWYFENTTRTSIKFATIKDRMLS